MTAVLIRLAKTRPSGAPGGLVELSGTSTGPAVHSHRQAGRCIHRRLLLRRNLMMHPTRLEGAIGGTFRAGRDHGTGKVGPLVESPVLTSNTTKRVFSLT